MKTMNTPKTFYFECKQIEILLLLAGNVFFSTSCKKNTEAGFTADKTTPYIGEPVHFTDNSEYRKNAQYFYDYGDGSTSDNDQTTYYLTTYGFYYTTTTSYTFVSENSSSNRNPTHIYLSPGIYAVTQNIIFNKNPEKGKNKIKSSAIQVTVLPIEADFSADKNSASVNESIYFTNTTKNIEKSIMYYMYQSFSWQAVNTDSVSSYPTYYNYKIVPQSGTSSLTDAIMSFKAKGKWKVILTLSTGTFSSSKTMDVVIN